MRWLRSLLFAIFLVVTVIPYAIVCVLWLPCPCDGATGSR